LAIQLTPYKTMNTNLESRFSTYFISHIVSLSLTHTET